MSPQLIFILGTIHMVTPMQNMDACNAALKGLDTAARFRSYCIDQRTGETIYARKRVREGVYRYGSGSLPYPVDSGVRLSTPTPPRLNNNADFERNI